MTNYYEFLRYDMEPFCKMFAQYVGNEDSRHSAERLFHSLFPESGVQLATERQKKQFADFCRELVAYHHFSILLNFIRGMMFKRQKYDLTAVYDLISDISIRENYNLAQLCADYVREVQKEQRVIAQIPNDADLYHRYPEELRLFDSGRGSQMGMVRTLMRYVYQLDFTDAQLTSADIDALVAYVRRESAGEYKENDNENCVYHRDRAIAGMLMPFLREADLHGDYALCYYMLQRYMMPTLAAAPWNRYKDESMIFVTESVCYCADFLRMTLFLREFGFIGFHEAANPTYLSREFYYDAIGRSRLVNSVYTGEKMQKYCQEHGRLFDLWAELLENGGKRLKAAMNPELYAFLMLYVPFVLFFHGQQEKASYFLLRHYGELDSNARSNPCYPILLARSILSCPHSDTANALYGVFSYELGRVERERKYIRKLSVEMLDFLQDARDYIQNENVHTLDGTSSWFDILFGDGTKDAFLQDCRVILDSQDILPSGMFDELCKQVRAFSHPTGVFLSWLDLPNCDGYDKLPNALSAELVRRGLGYWAAANQAYDNEAKDDEGKAYHIRATQLEPLRDINLHLQNHLFKLQKAELESNLARVRTLKKGIAKVLLEQEREELLEQISVIADDLAALAMGSAMRPEAERTITALRQEFEEKYLQGQVDLMQKLPEKIRADVHNYLVTSTMVFRMMEAKNDDTLDYSAALISMTKALELVMLHIYSRFDVKVYENMDYNTKKYYFNYGKPIKKQTLRPCIEVLKDDHFKFWGGDSVLDISMLRLFGDISVLVDMDENRVPRSTCFFSGEEEKTSAINRDILRRGLGYICENYRNRSAHPDVVTLMQVKECQQLLIDGQKLLWIILTILNVE